MKRNNVSFCIQVHLRLVFCNISINIIYNYSKDRYTSNARTRLHIAYFVNYTQSVFYKYILYEMIPVILLRDHHNEMAVQLLLCSNIIQANTMRFILFSIRINCCNGTSDTVFYKMRIRTHIDRNFANTL